MILTDDRNSSFPSSSQKLYSITNKSFAMTTQDDFYCSNCFKLGRGILREGRGTQRSGEKTL